MKKYIIGLLLLIITNITFGQKKDIETDGTLIYIVDTLPLLISKIDEGIITLDYDTCWMIQYDPVNKKRGYLSYYIKRYLVKRKYTTQKKAIAIIKKQVGRKSHVFRFEL